MLRSWACGAILLVSGFALPSSAQEVHSENPLPRIQPPCGAECLEFQPAKPTLQLPPEIRGDLLGNEQGYAPEGFVMVSYVVGTDGKTHDITPIIRLGHPRMADLVIEAVKGWTFTPAVHNGKPVAQMLTYRFYLRAKDKIMALIGAPAPVVPIVRGQKQDPDAVREARAQLEKNLALQKMTFMARAEVALPLIGQAMERNDYLEARRYAVMASVFGNLIMDNDVAEKAWGARLNADLVLGEMADAIFSFRALQRFPKYRQDSVLTGQVSDAVAKADAIPELLTRAVIPSEEDVPIYWHALYRNTFKFAQGTGSLDKFSLMCDQNMMEAQVSFTAQWSLPSRWRNCILFVSGAPGATFGVIETRDAGKAAN